jgi:hypothetical protein
MKTMINQDRSSIKVHQYSGILLLAFILINNNYKKNI